MAKKLILAGMVLAIIFSLVGCGRPGYFKELGKAKVGVTWEGDKSYSWLVSQELKKRTKLSVVDDQNLPQLANYESSQELAYLQNHHKVDYILVCSLPYLGSVEQKSNFSVAQKGVNINVNYRRKVQLAYKVISVATGELLLSGITDGEGSHNTYVRFDSQGASARLSSADDEALLVDAIKNAIRRSELL
jgi:uncharacterized lipoprotein YehR (DUF1307 family)